MAKKIARILVAVVLVLGFAFAGMVFGLLTGMNIGGNYFTDFVFMGSRGYEATGTIGSIIGVTLGALAGGLLARLLLKRK